MNSNSTGGEWFSINDNCELDVNCGRQQRNAIHFMRQQRFIWQNELTWCQLNVFLCVHRIRLNKCWRRASFRSFEELRGLNVSSIEVLTQLHSVKNYYIVRVCQSRMYRILKKNKVGDDWWNVHCPKRKSVKCQRECIEHLNKVYILPATGWWSNT